MKNFNLGCTIKRYLKPVFKFKVQKLFVGKENRGGMILPCWHFDEKNDGTPDKPGTMLQKTLRVLYK